ncbi:MAG: carboxypeptidase regulatory-like domain-containing protein [Gammaproteobacteria bacterium]|nr:carboxypeptidase regulatory-like domain-containing protein [Gammaproteobacteria bacterium]
MTGSVSDPGGSPLQGAIVTATHSGTRIETSVFSRPDGSFELPLKANLVTQLRVRIHGFETVVLPRLSISTPAAILMQPAADSLDVPSSEWLSLLPEGDMKREFTLNCTSCHEIGYPRIMLDGHARSEKQWQATFAAMKAMDQYAIIPDDFDANRYSAWLAESLSDERVEQVPAPPAIDPEAVAQLVITEYPLPVEDASPHDLVVGPKGRIWITGFFSDQIWALDPGSGDIEVFDVDTNPDESDQPRSLKFDQHGKLWIVNGGAEKVLRLDVTTRQYQSFDVGMYAHSLDLAANGDAWLNDYFSKPERIARVSAMNGEVTVLPVPSANLSAVAGLPLPYGLQIDRQDRLWSTQLAANTLVGYNIASGQASLYQMPMDNSGPRRLGIGPDGALWIPEFNTGYLSHFDGDTGEFERIRMGPSTLGLYDAAVDQRSGAVWVTASLASRLIRYQPATGEVTGFALPTQPAYMRHLAIDPSTGDVWSSYSSLPAAKPKLVRLQFRSD